MSLLEYRTTAAQLRRVATVIGLGVTELAVILPGAVIPWGARAIAANPPHLSQPFLTLAQSLEVQSSLDHFREITFRPPTPPDVGSPRERRGAASRGSSRDEGCPAILEASAPTLTALTPAYNTRTQSLIEGITHGADTLYGSTLEPYPTLWVYLPYDLTPNRPGELRAEVVGEDGIPIQKTLITYTDVPRGIVGIPLEGTAFEPLAIGEWRDLIFIIQCDRDDAARNLYVGFTVQRVAPLIDPDHPGHPTPASLAAVAPLDHGPEDIGTTANPDAGSSLKAATLERAAMLGEAGVWYDLLTTLAGLRRTDHDDADLAAHWSHLLESIGLADIADQPLSNCCTVPDHLAVETATPE